MNQKPLDNRTHREAYLIPVICFLICAVLYTTLNAPFHTQDAQNHFYRSLAISCGQMTEERRGEQTGFDLPVSRFYIGNDWDYYRADASLMEFSEETQFYYYHDTALYAPFAYLPQALGLFLARLFGMPFWPAYYLGIVINILFVAALYGIAAKWIPKGKQYVFLLLMLPMNLNLVASYSPDGMMIGLIVLMVSLVLHLRYVQKEKLSAGQYVLLYLLAISVSMIKIVYMPLCLLYFLIPSERFGSKKNYILHVICMIAAVAGLTFAWYYSTLGLFHVVGGESYLDGAGQVSWIFRHPFRYLAVIGRTGAKLLPFWLYEMLGGHMGLVDVKISPAILLPYAALLLFALIRSRNKPGEDFRRLLRDAIILLLLCFVLALTSQYVNWTPVGEPEIWGVQGRYFTPLLILVLLLFRRDYSAGEDPRQGARWTYASYALAVALNFLVALELSPGMP